MAGENPWSARYEFWKSMPARSHFLFMAGVFCMFLPAGLLNDIPLLGASRPVRLAAAALLSGTLAVAYTYGFRRGLRWTLLVIASHVLAVSQFDRIFGPIGPPLTGDALHARLALDVNISTTAILVSFLLISQLIRAEGARYGRMRAEIALAREIHRQLVPQITRRVGRFEFRGVSVASGDVGGDLIDLVESPDGWSSFVADVSGHGVAAGLLMGMVKSGARTQLLTKSRLEDLLNTLNAVLYALKGPAMFVTFAGLQFDGNAGLRFTVAGHLPILHYQAATTSVVELSIPQVPLAMFDDRSFTSATTSYASGDLFVILTDGLTEVFDRGDREFGLDRVKALIQAHAGASLEALEGQLLAAVHAHGPQLDDQTLLLIRATG
jgi:serine phosphatase RsbU (regulator of sigma subunit)